MAPFFLLLLLFVAPSSAEIRSGAIRSDARPIISLNEFGFTNSGVLELNITSVSLSNPNAAADDSKLGFFLTTRPSWLNVVRQLENSEIPCPLDSNLIRIVFPLSSLRQHNSSLSTIVFHPGAGRYSLAFANCVPGLRVSMTVSFAMYNLGTQTGSRYYLSSGTTPLPRVYSLFSLIYFAIAVYCMSLLYKKRRSESPPSHLMVHLILKSLTLLSNAKETSFINRTGLSHLPNYWLFLKLSMNMTFLPHLVIATLTRVPIDESGPKSLVLYEVGFFLSVAVLICVVLLVMKVMKLDSLKNQCAIGFCYLYLTSVVMFVVEVATSYRYLWTSVAAAELISLAFYVISGYKYRHYFAHKVDEPVVDHLKSDSVSLK